ncbi:MAG: DUF503 domain-containing protein [Synergistaceae bacterium]|nr:DUF503 domain-containing protein [Synergistaceae bacterium]
MTGRDRRHAPCGGILFASLQALGSRSIKDRRRVVRSLLDRIRRRWNVSASDLGPDGSWSRIDLAVSAVAPEIFMVEERLQAVLSFLFNEERTGEFSIIYNWHEVARYDDVSYAENKQTSSERGLHITEPSHKERDSEEGDYY